MTHRIDWDDLRFALAVAEGGSVAAAARRLGVNHTTVLRRIQAFEASHKIRLFDRLPTGYALTAEGEQLAAAARSIDETVATLERRMSGRDLKLEGVIRVTTTDSLMATVLPQHFASFRAKHPRITIELAQTNTRLNLTKRDADIAIRPARHLPTPLIGHHISDIAFAVYGADRYLGDCSHEDLKDHVWLGGDELLANSPVASWMHEHVSDVRIAFRADSFVALSHAVQAGLGVAALPCCLGDRMPGLKRIFGPVQGLSTRLWLLTHRDLSGAARIRAFMVHMQEALSTERACLEGRGGTGKSDGQAATR